MHFVFLVSNYFSCLTLHQSNPGLQIVGTFVIVNSSETDFKEGGPSNWYSSRTQQVIGAGFDNSPNLPGVYYPVFLLLLLFDLNASTCISNTASYEHENCNEHIFLHMDTFEVGILVR